MNAFQNNRLDAWKRAVERGVESALGVLVSEKYVKTPHIFIGRNPATFKTTYEYASGLTIQVDAIATEALMQTAGINPMTSGHVDIEASRMAQLSVTELRRGRVQTIIYYLSPAQATVDLETSPTREALLDALRVILG